MSKSSRACFLIHICCYLFSLKKKKRNATLIDIFIICSNCVCLLYTVPHQLNSKEKQEKKSQYLIVLYMIAKDFNFCYQNKLLILTLFVLPALFSSSQETVQVEL